MTENAGRIEYEFVADTTSILKAEALLDKSNQNVVKSFEAADRAAKSFAKTQDLAGNTINKAGQVMDANGKILTQQTQQYRTLETQAVKSLINLKEQSENSFVAASTNADLLKKNLESLASAKLDKINKTFDAMGTGAANLEPKINNITKGIKRVGEQANRSSFQASNFSYQIQDIAVQAQMGISPLVIFAQQFPQMAVGMGAAAAGIGAVVAILGALGTALLKSKSEMEKFEKAVENTKAVMTLGADGVVEYTKQMKELNKVSEQLAKIKLAEGILEQNKVIASSSKLIVESAETTSKLYKSTFEEMRGLTESVAAEIGGSMADVAEAIKSGQNIGAAGSYLNRDLDNIAAKFKITRDEALQLGLALSDVAKGGGAVAIKSLQNVVEDLSASYGYSNEKITKLASGMVKYFIASNQATDGVNELRMALFDKGQAIDEDVEGTKKLEQAYKSMEEQLEYQRVKLEEGARAAFEYSLAQQKLTNVQKESLLAMYDKNMALSKESESLKQTASDLEWYEQAVLKASEADRKSNEQLDAKVQGLGIDPIESIKARYDEELALLEEHKQKINSIEIDYAARSAQIEKNKTDAIARYNKQQAANNSMVGANQLQVMSTIAGAMGTLVNSMDKSSKESFDRWKKYALAQAVVSTAMGVANALATPAPWPVAAAMGIAAGVAGAVQIATISNQQFSGGRQYGGPVSNGMYRVNETGVPEIYSHGGKDYLMNTKNANIKPLEQSGSGGMQVIVNNNTPYEVYVTQDQAASIATVQIGREAGKLAKGQGTMYNALRAGTLTRGNASN